ncbi:hypothetical protein FKM82_015989 [Ascaphus truei]
MLWPVLNQCCPTCDSVCIVTFFFCAFPVPPTYIPVLEHLMHVMGWKTLTYGNRSQGFCGLHLFVVLMCHRGFCEEQRRVGSRVGLFCHLLTNEGE